MREFRTGRCEWTLGASVRSWITHSLRFTFHVSRFISHPLSPRLTTFARQTFPMRACVIFNPVAKGDKARRFRARLEVIGKECVLMKTAAAGDARRLTAHAIEEGFDLVIAAGGDGTLNEVLNGFGDVPEGFRRACLGVLPV